MSNRFFATKLPGSISYCVIKSNRFFTAKLPSPNGTYVIVFELHATTTINEAKKGWDEKCDEIRKSTILFR